jgi:hypothetical protein
MDLDEALELEGTVARPMNWSELSPPSDEPED